ncbi:hypothetical protein I6A60_19795 [Frankia sp. AgB1.9]|uniref:hypothetical protein n=1 Tax=unclassified Frankia TaxID=2632575 RepID=UPI001931D60B|nr:MULTISPECIES: hypothetical protein [unclassified Frankia]MBL7494423.1 hypothetical protein [Frankia sp. AgW1.1]MBL7550106.1 hypothetical protein [Frankia sp. AgB1.9]MBL7621150.1 hypothetical protein [Frankia sp. AgB1.8]
MNEATGVRVVVQGDLPDDVMMRIRVGIRSAVLAELAQTDLAPKQFPVPLEPFDLDPGLDPSLGLQIPQLLGWWFKEGPDGTIDPGTPILATDL